MVGMADSEMPFFVSQQPAGGDGELLMRHHPEYQGAVDRVVQHIVAAAKGLFPEVPPFAFVVQAPWGAGKSTALEYVRAGLKNCPNLAVVQFEASSWDRQEGLTNPRSALALGIAQALFDPTEWGEIEHNLDGKPSVSPMGDGWDMRSHLGLAEAISRQVAGTLLLERWIAEKLAQRRRSAESGPEGTGGQGASSDRGAGAGGPDGAVRAVVVLADDVDRCSLSFTAGLLHASCLWSGVRDTKFFFGFASGRHHLEAAMREHPPGGASRAAQALQKYVQIWFDIPPFFGSDGAVPRFLAQLLGGDGAVRGEPHVLEDLVRRLDRAVEDYEEVDKDHRLGIGAEVFRPFKSDEYCLLAPLLRVDGRTTPREVKERLNAVLAHYPRSNVDEGNVKNSVIRAFWPDFWWKCLQPVFYSHPNNRSPRVAALAEEITGLVELGKTLEGYWRLPDEKLESIFQAVMERPFSLIETPDPRLAIYLALRPVVDPNDGSALRIRPGLLLPRGEGSVKEERYTEINKAAPDELPRLDEGVPPVDPLARSAVRAASGGRRGQGRSDDALMLYLESEQAMKDGRPGARSRAVQALERLLRLAHSGRLGSGDSVPVANGAVNAENLEDFALAEGLYQEAMTLDPEGWGNIQNYVDFLIMQRQEESYDRADELLTQLEIQGHEYKPEKTRAMRQRLEAARKEGDAPAIAEEVLARIRQEPTLDVLVANWRLMEELQVPGVVVSATQLVTMAARSDSDRYTSLRLLADHLATDGDRRMSAEIYRYLLCRGLCGAAVTGGGGDADAVRHNLATLLASLDHRDAALVLWRGIYDGGRADGSVRRALAMALSSRGTLGDQADAREVMEGRPISSPVPEPPPMPDHLYDGERWWEEVPIARYDSSGDDWLWPSRGDQGE
jgi:hypothetical protein